jgi:hypothetical protein
MSLRPRPSMRLLSLTALVVILAGLTAAPAAASAPGPNQRAAKHQSPVAAEYAWAEKYALSLLNCDRTGGWITEAGKCVGGKKGQRSEYRKPLTFSERLASEISRPQARRLAAAGYLDHYLGGSIATRFKRAGITCCAYGENLGHYVRGIKNAVLQIHRMMQAERPYFGPHWQNFKDKRYRYVGIGVWTKGNDVYVAYDFWDGRTHY